MVLGTFAFAQPAGPYDITVSGIVAGCNPNATSYVTITTQQGTQPELDIEVPLDANCSFFITLPMDSYMGWFLVSTPCNGAIQSATVNYEYNVFQPDSNYVFVVLNCTGQQPADCLGIPGGPNTVGTACTDPATGTAGFWNSDCLCIPDTANTACEANFWVLQAYTTSNEGDTTTTVPVPNEVWVWNLTSGGEAPYTYLWSFGDGTSSVDPYPTHFYASGGTYQLCLTIADAAGCTSVHCDTITVDENGMYSGMVIDGRPGMLRNGFTLNVIAELPTAVAERKVVDEVALWPNPVEDVIGLAFTSNRSASLSLRIVDLNGREVRTSNSAVNAGNNRHSINVSDLVAGIYLLQISDGTHSTSRRFVKQ
jgi:PKD repeat protein